MRVRIAHSGQHDVTVRIVVHVRKLDGYAVLSDYFADARVFAATLALALIGTLAVITRVWWRNFRPNIRNIVRNLVKNATTPTVTKVTYGRTIECGRFGGGRRTGKVWFGWEVHLPADGSVSAAEALADLKAKADLMEESEREEFDERQRKSR